MKEQGEQILRGLHVVADERSQRAADPALGNAVLAVKAFQHARFQASYADMLASPRYGRAASFFLEDLYGPMDFSQRDTQFARVVPGLVRLFPADLVSTVVSLADLHALSETLDTAMARALPGPEPITGARYGQAWRTVGQPPQREQQIALMLAVGSALDRYTRNPFLRHTLRLMRGPAHAAGMGALQSFLETGFDTFREMRGAAPFLDTVAKRERALAAQMFAGGDASLVSPPALTAPT